MKCCSRCHDFKPDSEYWKQRQARDGLQSQCKPCSNAARAANPNRLAIQRRSDYKGKHGLVPIDPGPCALCGRVGPLAVDHDHACCPSGKSCYSCQRGLVCSNCNLLIDLFEDKPDLWDLIPKYVAQPPGVPTWLRTS